MLKSVKKSISVLIAIGMMLSSFPIGAGAEEEFPQFSANADELIVNSTNTGFTNLPSYVDNDCNNMQNEDIGRVRAYKLTNAFGTTDGDSVIEFVAREQRQNEPQFLFSGINFTTDSDFYITQDIYIGEARSQDMLQLGARYFDKDGNRKDAFFFLDGDGNIIKNYLVASGNKAHAGAYQPNNWYRLTFAVTNKDVKLYFDDLVVHQREDGRPRTNIGIDYDLNDVGSDFSLGFFGPRIRTYTDTTDWSGLPMTYAIKDMKFVQGTYDPANTDTSITSDTYIVDDKSVYFIGGDVTGTSYVSGINTNTTVGDVLDNITVPSGATKKIITINADDKATTVMSNETIATSAMKLMVTAVDGAMKLYDLKVEMSAEDTPLIESSLERYVIDEDAMTITMPETSIAKLKSVVTSSNGSNIAVTKANGSVVESGPITDTMSVVVSKNGNVKKYDVVISNSQAFSTPDLSSIADGQMLFEATATNSKYYTQGTRIYPYTDNGDGTYSTTSTALYGFALPNASFDAAYTHGFSDTTHKYEVYKDKIPGTTIDAYKFTYPAGSDDLSSAYASHKAGNFVEKTTNANVGDKMVIKFKLYLEDGGLFSIYPYHAFNKSGGGVGGEESQTSYNKNAGIGDRVTFGNVGGTVGVHLGGKKRTGAWVPELVRSGVTYGTTIGNYETKTLYDVTIVQSRGTWDDNGTTKSSIITEGVYLNGTNLLSEPSVLNVTTNQYFGIREIGFYTQGTTYMSDLNIYMADDYNPAEYVEPEEPDEPGTPDGADLDLTSDTVTIEGRNILGWEGMTAAELKAAVDSNINTEVTILNVSGDAEVADTRNVTINMLIEVRDINNSDNVAYYILTKENTDTGIYFTIEGGKIIAKRDINIFNAVESSSKALIFGAYDGKKLLDAGASENYVVGSADTYSYSVELDYDSSKEYKAFMWDLDTLKPYENVVPYSAN